MHVRVCASVCVCVCVCVCVNENYILITPPHVDIFIKKYIVLIRVTLNNEVYLRR